MTKTQARLTFDNYNPHEAVTRCPSGRAPVRKMLDDYAKAAVNLYGIISIKDFVEIFNSQNTEQTNAAEIFTLLLPDIVKKNKCRDGAYYCFYKDCIIHYWAMDDFDIGVHWLREQEDKSRFIPEKNEFLKYKNEYYEDKVQKMHWNKVFNFILKEWPNNKVFAIYDDLKINSQFLCQLEIGGLQEKYDLSFDTTKQIQYFFDLLQCAHNNTRMWPNKGYTPKEMMKMFK